NDLHAPAGRGTHPLQESARVAGVAQGASRDHTDGIGAITLAGAMKAAENLHRQSNGLGRKKSAAENRLAEAGDLAVFVNFNQTMCTQAGNLQADGVRSDVNGGESWHSRTVYRESVDLVIEISGELGRLRDLGHCAVVHCISRAGRLAGRNGLRSFPALRNLVYCSDQRASSAAELGAADVLKHRHKR